MTPAQALHSLIEASQILRVALVEFERSIEASARRENRLPTVRLDTSGGAPQDVYPPREISK